MLISATAYAKEDHNRAVARTDTSATEQRVALVIGNSAYKTSPLNNPSNDATDIANELRRLDFKVILRRDRT